MGEFRLKEAEMDQFTACWTFHIKTEPPKKSNIVMNGKEICNIVLRILVVYASPSSHLCQVRTRGQIKNNKKAIPQLVYSLRTC